MTSRQSHHSLANLEGVPGLPEGKKLNISIKRNHHTKRTHKIGHRDGTTAGSVAGRSGRSHGGDGGDGRRGSRTSIGSGGTRTKAGKGKGKGDGRGSLNGAITWGNDDGKGRDKNGIDGSGKGRDKEGRNSNDFVSC